MKTLILACAFLVFSLIGIILPYRKKSTLLLWRWFNNLLLFLVIPIIAKAIPFLSISFLMGYYSKLKFGILYDVPLWANIIFSFIILDFVIYWQHRLFHQFNWAWKFHRVHHTDPDFDTSTAIRFHPIEIFLSLGIKIATALLLGMSIYSVLIFEVSLSFFSLFNHSNFQLPQGIDNILKKIIVTPSYHRIHHTNHSFEINSNYCTIFSLWDYLFKSHTHKAKEDLSIAPLGICHYQKKEDQRFDRLLFQPFKN